MKLFKELFLGTLTEKITWEEIENSNLNKISHLPKNITADQLLQVAIWLYEQDTGAMKIDEGAKNFIQNRLLYLLTRELKGSKRIVFMEVDGNYVEIPTNKIIDTSKYRLEYKVPLSRYVAEEDIIIENGKFFLKKDFSVHYYMDIWLDRIKC